MIKVCIIVVRSETSFWWTLLLWYEGINFLLQMLRYCNLILQMLLNLKYYISAVYQALRLAGHGQPVPTASRSRFLYKMYCLPDTDRSIDEIRRACSRMLPGLPDTCIFKQSAQAACFFSARNAFRMKFMLQLIKNNGGAQQLGAVVLRSNSTASWLKPQLGCKCAVGAGSLKLPVSSQSMAHRTLQPPCVH